MINYHCENCGQLLSSRAQSIGKKRRCPSCHAYTIVDSLPVGVTTNAQAAAGADSEVGVQRHAQLEEQIGHPPQTPNPQRNTDFVIVRDDHSGARPTDFVIVGKENARNGDYSRSYHQVAEPELDDYAEIVPPTSASFASMGRERSGNQHATTHLHDQPRTVRHEEVATAPETSSTTIAETEQAPNDGPLAAVIVDVRIPFGRKIQICFEWAFAILSVLLAIALIAGVLIVPLLIMMGYRP